jgi:hypothetical protein
MHGEKRNAYRILVRNPRWEDNIKMKLRETGWDILDWIDLAQDRKHMAGSWEDGNEPSGSIKCWEIPD